MKKILQKSELILTYIFLLALPWQTRWIFRPGALNGAYWEYATLSLYALDFIIVAIIILQIIRRKNFGFNFYIFCAALAVALTSFYIADDKIISLVHIAWFVMAGGLIISFCNSLLTKKQLILTFVIGAALAGLFGVWQFTAQSAPAQKWFGLAAHDSSDLGTSVVETIAPDGRPERWLRAYGPLDHPNIFGGLMALGLILALWLAKEREGEKNSALNLISIMSIVSLSAGLVVSFSRAAWLSAVLGIILLLIYEAKKSIAAMKNLWLPLGTAVIVAGLFILPYYYIISPRIFGSTRLENKSVIERVAGFKESVNIFKAHPIIGSGLGNYGLALQKLEPKELVWFYQPVHNIFFLLLAEVGLFGLAVFLLITCLFFVKAWQNQKNRTLTLSLIGAFIILVCFDHWLVSLHSGIFISATVLGLMLKKD